MAALARRGPCRGPGDVPGAARAPGGRAAAAAHRGRQETVLVTVCLVSHFVPQLRVASEVHLGATPPPQLRVQPRLPPGAHAARPARLRAAHALGRAAARPYGLLLVLLLPEPSFFELPPSRLTSLETPPHPSSSSGVLQGPPPHRVHPAGAPAHGT
eukprot:CAMPEP_0173400580 /NCGR_PEP_ID=MMETSP1356-20130122/48286_1 /TAXON_ID=77927 ORGANISM="Hemiselmis virescens, Strain PCC157" /NCGR_SAMPLE_ID=MMETSP1356 /ASSEMBLY_ACC=CAM_ASM_000847 /LENGTH=156 /DNA_ID=CAMNT_0014360533 /DNA_START=197 /DNA_END=664 /DNA_ORIENTATION=-